jgi:hypothetical protein
MGIIKKGTYEVYYTELEKREGGLTLSEAKQKAESFCGNNSCTALPMDGTLLYGPGDGTTSAMVREEIEFA